VTLYCIYPYAGRTLCLNMWGILWNYVWGTQLDCAKPNQNMCHQIVVGVVERENMASWVLYFVSLFHYASKMTDRVEESTKSASSIQMSSDKIMSPSCWHWVGMSRRQSMLKSLKMERMTLICKENSTSNLTCFVLKLYEINNKIFFSEQTCFTWGYLASGQIHFPLADLFIRGSPCIW